MPPWNRKVEKQKTYHRLVVNVPRVWAKNSVLGLFFVGMAAGNAESYSQNYY